MLIKKRPRSYSRFNNSSISISTNEYKELVLNHTVHDITVEISSELVVDVYDLPEKKTIKTSRLYILENAVARVGEGNVYYTVQLPKEQAVSKTKYIVFEGEEGTGKTTQTTLLATHLREKGFSVLETKEPGTKHLPLTLALRKIMLDGQYEDQITATAREFISQSIRSIHLEKLIYPTIEENKYDFIIQDRGVLSGLAYGAACGNDIDWLRGLAQDVSKQNEDSLFELYSNTVYLTGNVDAGLKRALASKQEFKAGDAMESRGGLFIGEVSENFKEMSQWFDADTINVDDKSIEQVFNEVLNVLGLA